MDSIINLILLKLKFAASSLLATIVDYLLYLTLFHFGVNPVPANVMSAGTGMLINFFLQKKYVFILNRKIEMAFIMSLSFSIVGIGISTSLIFLLNKITFFENYQFITKAMVTGILFFYNFFTKRLSFEKKIL